VVGFWWYNQLLIKIKSNEKINFNFSKESNDSNIIVRVGNDSKAINSHLSK
jgi:hypothetical protein